MVAPERELGAQERARHEKEVARLKNLIERARRQLSDEAFLSKAPAQVVEAKRTKLGELEGRLATVEAGL